MTQRTQRLSRRNFLLAVGAGGAATAAALATRDRRPAAPEKDAGDRRTTRGYRMSEHVNNYYRTTKV